MIYTAPTFLSNRSQKASYLKNVKHAQSHSMTLTHSPRKRHKNHSENTLLTTLYRHGSYLSFSRFGTMETCLIVWNSGQCKVYAVDQGKVRIHAFCIPFQHPLISWRHYVTNVLQRRTYFPPLKSHTVLNIWRNKKVSGR